MLLREDVHSKNFSWFLGVAVLTDNAFRTCLFLLLSSRELLNVGATLLLSLHLSHDLLALEESKLFLVVTLLVLESLESVPEDWIVYVILVSEALHNVVR